MSIQFSRLALLRDVRLWRNDTTRAAFIATAFFLIAGPATTSLAQAQAGYLTYPTGITPAGVTAADLNGDGLPDLVIANAGSNSLTVLLNDGAGGFKALPPISLGQANLEPQSIIAADLNGDRKTDLLVIGSSAQPLIPTNSAGGLAVLLGNGDGTFQPPLLVTNETAYAAQVADLNGDGIPDLAIIVVVGVGGLTPSSGKLVILPGNGDGTFGTATAYDLGLTAWGTLAIGDFNQDGKPDIAVATGGAITVFLNDGKGNFNTTTHSDEPWAGATIVAADFNDDGRLDLAVWGESQSEPVSEFITVLLGQGDGTFKAGPTLQTANTAGQMVAMDLNGDGYVDLAVGISRNVYNTGPAGLVFFAGRGDGSFENGLSFGGSGNTGSFAIADFTGGGVMGFAGINDFATPAAVQTDGNTVILPRATWPSPTLANTSAAGFGLGPLAPGSIATAFGVNLAAQTAQPAGTPPVSLGGTTVSVTDSAGTVRPAQLFYVSPTQVNYLIPAGTAPGLAIVTITASGNVTATGPINIVPVAPALFTMNPANLVAANVVLVSQNGDQTFETIYQTDQNGNVSALPIDFGSGTDTVYLVLYGTGIRNVTSQSAVTATIGWSLNATVTYAGPQCCYAGLDQVNLQLPSALATAAPSTTTLQLIVDGQPSNQVTLLVQ
ncbi:MAG: FG-GAP-like repeat-containing protein [Bryobacteraceae bacterium]|jgi:uncharacterized protein (TIGR03437 family)